MSHLLTKCILKSKILFFKLLKLFPFAKPKLIYVALGDSLVEGVGASHPNNNFVSKLSQLLSKDYQVKTINLGKNGSTSSDLLEKQIPEVLKIKPNLVTLTIGANDIRRNHSIKTFSHNLNIILNLLKSTDSQIAITTLPDIAKVPAIPKILKWYVRYRTLQFNKIIESVAQDNQLIVCDLYHPSRLLANFDRYIAEDNLHLSDEGYNLWANYLFGILRLKLT
jgi:lysophospholipase L1-like esterase